MHVQLSSGGYQSNYNIHHISTQGTNEPRPAALKSLLREDINVSAGKMETSLSTSEELDDEFDRSLVKMKPHVLRLSPKSERQRCANWIKKLCEPPGSGPTARKNRNLYANLLLHMLQKGLIEGPFAHRPQPGPLPTLPAHMSIYFDEPRHASFPAHSESGAVSLHVPDWVYSELSQNGSSSSTQPTATSTLREKYHSTTGSWLHQRARSENEVVSANAGGDEDYHKTQSNVHQEMFSYDASGTMGPGSPSKTSFQANSTLREGTIPRRQHEKELEMRTKMMEAKHHEEKLQLQQRHDGAIQKILDRKNSEMEDMKSHYRSKSKEMETTVRKLERKVQSLVKESVIIRDSKDQQIAELKKMVEHSDQSTQNEFETKLHEKTTEFEQEKFEMQKHHTRAIQEILDDTNARLHKMETEYSEQVDHHATVIRDLEERITQLTQESENQNAAQAELDREKADLERTNRLVNAELENIRTSQSAETIRELEQHVQDLKQQLQESEHRRQRELRDLESMLKQDKLHQENLHEKQILSLRSELEGERQDNHNKILKVQQAIRDKDDQLEKSAELRKMQTQQAEKALEEFKLQVEQNSSRMFEDMKAQMQKVEADLLQSKDLRQTQAKEYARQLDQERKRFEKQFSEQEALHNEKLSQLVQQHQMEQESMQQEHERILAGSTGRLQSRIDEERNQSVQRQDQDATVIRELEQQVRELRQANMQNDSLRKQQLVELGLLREEEKQKAHRESETAVSKLKSEMEQQRLRLQRDHSAEMEQMLQETNARLKNIETDYTERLAKTAENNKQLTERIETLQQEFLSSRNELERQMSDAITKLEDEKELLKKQHSAYLKTLHQDLDKQRTRARQVERELQQKDFQHQDRMTHLKQEYEHRMRGLMPLNVRQELEDTIESLKAQVSALQQRSMLLQEDIDKSRKATVRSPSRN
ncbi:centrosomal protein of 112 kDa-like [Acanthaster planci]|uniref:Centrosomal protein of 112 kDa-like n=1 Tax=Acanthaster planci TaxID=133434 RepID=A0A8B7ZJI7_ACAPL|nr:centrosomal protein of 112 kDa-like [Acanthaster planci]